MTIARSESGRGPGARRRRAGELARPAPAASAALQLQQLAGNRAVTGLVGQVLQRAPTYGNVPRDAPQAPHRDLPKRVELRVVDGKWREVVDGRVTGRARGRYAFVVQDGRIFAVKDETRMDKMVAGHTEAAEGGRVSWAGMVRINRNTGQVMEWDDNSGHYRPAASLHATAVQAGMPEDKWKQSEATAPKPDPVTGRPTRPRHPVTGEPLNPQLPVEQPATRSRDGSGPKIKPGPPRLAELEADLKAGKGKPPEQLDIKLPKLTLRGVGRMAGRSALMLLAGWILGRFTERAIQSLMDKQIKALEPHIDELLKDAVARSVPPGWLQQSPRQPYYAYITLDASRDGMYDGDLHDYYWGIPTVSIHRVLVTTPQFAKAFGQDRDGPWNNPYFERTGLGTMFEHNYFTTKIPLENLVAT